MRTAKDFEKEEEERVAKAKAAEEEAGVEKIPVMNKDGNRYMCANKGCADKNFVPEENSETACKHHTGEPVFHDLKKFWSCCKDQNKVALDWDEFMKIPTCSEGAHMIRYKNV